MKRVHLCLLLTCLCMVLPASAWAQTTSRPMIRTITAFVEIDREHYVEQLGAATAMLDDASSQFGEAGWIVQSVRITTQPFPQYVGDLPTPEAVAFLQELDGLASAQGFGLSVGPAMRADGDDARMMDVLAGFLAGAQMTNASAFIAVDTPRGGEIQWGVIDESVELIQHLKDNSPGSSGNFNFAATAMVEPYSPFFPASWHEKGKRFAIGLQSADVMTAVLSETGFDPARAAARLSEELGAHALEVERVARAVASGSHYKYVGIDPTAATYADFASVGAAMEAFTEAPLGGSGTMTAARIITDAVRSLPVRQVGLRGLMMPVLEDGRIAQRWAEGRISIDSLLSYSAVCGTGLDTVPLPGSVTDAQLVRILGDVATLATKWNKPLTARLFPAKGLEAGDATQFNNPYLVDTVLQPLPGAPQPAPATADQGTRSAPRSIFGAEEPSYTEGGLGCTVSAPARSGAAWLLVAGFGLLVLRRRRY